MRILIKNKKILITGIYGFLGKHLAERLQHDNEIIGINKPDESKNFETEIAEAFDLNNSKNRKYIFSRYEKNWLQYFP